VATIIQVSGLRILCFRVHKKELSVSNILRSTEDILSSVSNIQKAKRGRLIILFLMLGRSVGGVQG
jgi:hypothetical protein